MASTRPTATKNLSQRTSKVPPPPKFPSTDWRPTSSANTRDSHRHGGDGESRRLPRRSPSPARHAFRGRSPAQNRTPVREPVCILYLADHILTTRRCAISTEALSPTMSPSTSLTVTSTTVLSNSTLLPAAAARPRPRPAAPPAAPAPALHDTWHLVHAHQLLSARTHALHEALRLFLAR